MAVCETLSQELNSLRQQRRLTVQDLAKKADVPQSLISGLQTGSRVIGEQAARKIGQALQLTGDELESFVYLAINQCSDKVLRKARDYPAELLNLIAERLCSLEILPERILRCLRKPQTSDPSADAALYLTDGRSALINVQVRCT